VKSVPAPPLPLRFKEGAPDVPPKRDAIGEAPPEENPPTPPPEELPGPKDTGGPPGDVPKMLAPP